ncbi:hypothetical protein [Fuerstiella marisgermanici]|uniref:Uncharacterized protein n=1 Tax=Fuerstiella marisgermanici TaxID=1891926 RepID=A0A1P8WGZ1_9PLAN|nr:hypothetical protein [Fuerstiella marisgermanici]APZ93334.1 hypothetical protein Fuma_02951 [Fuerstiella marisgermanici]
MKNKTRRVTVDIQGQEEIRHIRSVIMEVPEDMLDEEVECVNADHFNQVEERSEWEVDDSSGIYAEGFPTLVGPAAPDAEPDLIVVRDDNGEFRVCGNEKFLLS